MKVSLHADDFGLTKKITDDILECIDAGVINSVSVMVNGYSFEYAMEQLLKRAGKTEVSLHLNLDQGVCVSHHSKMQYLVDKNNFLRAGFERLFVMYYTSSKEKRSAIQQELKSEIAAQIEMLLPYLKKLGQPLRIDSERCVHMLPFVFTEIVEFSATYNISFIRIAKEPVYFYLRSIKDIKYYLGANLVKNILMQWLAYWGEYRKLLTEKRIHFSEITFGLLHGSDVDLELCSFYVDYAKRKKAPMVQIVFHPFMPEKEELHFWDNYSAYKRFFSSKKIPKEKNYLLQNRDEFNRLLRGE